MAENFKKPEFNLGIDDDLREAMLKAMNKTQKNKERQERQRMQNKEARKKLNAEIYNSLPEEITKNKDKVLKVAGEWLGKYKPNTEMWIQVNNALVAATKMSPEAIQKAFNAGNDGKIGPSTLRAIVRILESEGASPSSVAVKQEKKKFTEADNEMVFSEEEVETWNKENQISFPKEAYNVKVDTGVLKNPDLFTIDNQRARGTYSIHHIFNDYFANLSNLEAGRDIDSGQYVVARLSAISPGKIGKAYREWDRAKKGLDTIKKEKKAYEKKTIKEDLDVSFEDRIQEAEMEIKRKFDKIKDAVKEEKKDRYAEMRKAVRGKDFPEDFNVGRAPYLERKIKESIASNGVSYSKIQEVIKPEVTRVFKTIEDLERGVDHAKFIALEESFENSSLGGNYQRILEVFNQAILARNIRRFRGATIKYLPETAMTQEKYFDTIN